MHHTKLLHEFLYEHLYAEMRKRIYTIQKNPKVFIVRKTFNNIFRILIYFNGTKCNEMNKKILCAEKYVFCRLWREYHEQVTYTAAQKESYISAAVAENCWRYFLSCFAQIFYERNLNNRVRWGGMGMWGEMGSLLIFELEKKKYFFKKLKHSCYLQ